MIASGKAPDSQEQIDKLEAENKELVEARKEQMDKVTEMLKEEIELELNIIPEDTLPEDVTAKQINSIINIIE